MKKSKILTKVISLVTAFIMLFTLGSVTAFAETTSGEYTYYDNHYESKITGITITAYSGNEVNLVIPSKIDNKNVEVLSRKEVVVNFRGSYVYPFGDNPTIESVVVPDTVIKIYWGSFSNDTNLSSISLPNKKISIGEKAFENTAYYNNQNNWTNGALYIGNHLIKVSTDVAGSFSIKEGTINIAEGAFSGCDNITEVIVPSSIEEIPYKCFYGLSNLSKVKLNEGLLSISDQAFANCTGLKEINFPSTLKHIGNSAFYFCTGLKEIALPKSLEYIGYNAFQVCEGIKEITIPENVEFVGGDAFSYCTSLAKITDNSNAEIASSAFSMTEFEKNNWEDNSLYIGNLLLNTEFSQNDVGIFFDLKIKNGTKRIATNITDTGYNPVSFIKVSIPESVDKLLNRTFLCNDHECPLIEVTIYNRNIVIEDYALFRSGSTDNFIRSLTIICYKNSTADKFAQKFGINVRYLEEPVEYKFTAGANQTVTQGEKASFTINGDFEKFSKIQIDGADVDAKNYTAVSGSTKITLSDNYTKTLKAGQHTLTAVYSDGKVSTTFTVIKASSVSSEISSSSAPVSSNNTTTSAPISSTVPSTSSSLDDSAESSNSTKPTSSTSSKAPTNPTVSTSSTASDTSPLTGENSNMYLWIFIGVVSLAGLSISCALSIKKHKKSH